MQAQSLTRIKLANAVKVGDSEGVFFQHDKFELTKNGFEIEITERKTGKATSTSLFNTVFWERAGGETLQQVAHESAKDLGKVVVRRRGRPSLASRAGAQEV